MLELKIIGTGYLMCIVAFFIIHTLDYHDPRYRWVWLTYVVLMPVGATCVIGGLLSLIWSL